MKKSELHAMSVVDLHAECERITEEMTGLSQQRDDLHKEALALHEERVPFEEELASRAREMGTTVPRLVLDAHEMAAGEHDEAE